MTKQLIDLVLGEIKNKVTSKEYSEICGALENYDDFLKTQEKWDKLDAIINIAFGDKTEIDKYGVQYKDLEEVGAETVIAFGYLPENFYFED